MKTFRIVLSDEAREVFEHLNKEAVHSKTDRMILNGIKQKIELIRQNSHYGDPIAKNLIPKEYFERYEISNLFRVELPSFWRMLYTLQGESKIEIVAFVLDIVDHKDYNKLFGYRKR